MCGMITSVLRVLVGSEWSKKLLSVKSDGASNMVCRHRGLQTLLERQCDFPIFRVWCGAHQLDLIVEACIANRLHSRFYQPLKAQISYLRRQQRFTADIRFQCPTVATTCWLSLGRLVRWIVRNRVEIIEYIERDDKSAFEKPTEIWWLLMFAVEALMETTDVFFRSIKGNDTLIVEQNDRFAKLHGYIESLFTLRRDNGVDILSATALGTRLFSDCGIMELSLIHI